MEKTEERGWLKESYLILNKRKQQPVITVNIFLLFFPITYLGLCDWPWPGISSTPGRALLDSNLFEASLFLTNYEWKRSNSTDDNNMK